MVIWKPALACAALLTLFSQVLRAEDWLAWRGPNGNGVAQPGQNLPHKWSETEGILWKAPIPGRGHSSPIVVGDLLLLTTADEEALTQSVVAYHRETGAPAWSAVVNVGEFPTEIHKKNTHATPTLASDGERLFAVFHNHGQAQLSCLTLSGEILWQIAAGPFQPERYEFGFAPSPLLHQGLVIVSAEFEHGFLAAFDASSGREVWRVARELTSYSSPIVAPLAGRDQLLLSGGNRITSYDPLTGETRWEADGASAATAGTVVWDGEMAFASGGYPESETIGVLADGSGRTVWRQPVKGYEQSMLAHEGHVYLVSDSGIAHCFRASDGEEQWKQRLSGPVSSSPTLVDGVIYVSNERGTTYVFRATPERFESLAENQLGDEAFASPTVCRGRMYLRVAETTDRVRRETLYCIGR